MIISNKQLESILQLNRVSEPRKKAPVQTTETSSARTDSLVLSSQAQELQYVKEQVLKSPEVNADKIGELKKQIQEGNYQVSAGEIAQKMIGRSLVDELMSR